VGTAARTAPSPANVHEHGGLGGHGRYGLVAEHAVVYPALSHESGIGCRGEGDDLYPVRTPLRQQEGKPQRRLARRARDDHLPRTKELLILQELGAEERQAEQRPQHQVLVLVRPVVAGVAVDEHVLVAGPRQLLAMRRTVDEPGSPQPARPQDEMRRHGKIAIDALALTHLGMARANDVAEAPPRDVAPALGRREKAPVRDLIAEPRVVTLLVVKANLSTPTRT